MLAFYKKPLFAAFLLVVVLSSILSVYAQSGGSSTSVTGTVVDPTGAVVGNAAVVIHNPVSGFNPSPLRITPANSASPIFRLIPTTLRSTGQDLLPTPRMLTCALSYQSASISRFK